MTDCLLFSHTLTTFFFFFFPTTQYLQHDTFIKIVTQKYAGPKEIFLQPLMHSISITQSLYYHVFQHSSTMANCEFPDFSVALANFVPPFGTNGIGHFLIALAISYLKSHLLIFRT